MGLLFSSQARCMVLPTFPMILASRMIRKPISSAVGFFNSFLVRSLLKSPSIEHDPKMIKFFLWLSAKDVVNANDSNKGALFSWVCRGGYYDIAKLLLENGADSSNQSLLLWACCCGHYDIVKLLLENGADFSKDLLERVCARNRYEILHGGACGCHKYYDIAKLLLENGADANIVSEYSGLTPLFLSIYDCGVIEGAIPSAIRFVELLLEKGANYNISNRNGETPLYLACQKGCVEVVELLLKYDVDINYTDSVKPPLYVACNNLNLDSLKREKTVELLLACGAKVEKQLISQFVSEDIIGKIINTVFNFDNLYTSKEKITFIKEQDEKIQDLLVSRVFYQLAEERVKKPTVKKSAIIDTVLEIYRRSTIGVNTDCVLKKAVEKIMMKDATNNKYLRIVQEFVQTVRRVVNFRKDLKDCGRYKNLKVVCERC